MFARLAEVMQQPELASAERYGPKELRLAARDDVNRIVAEWVASLDLETVLAHCSRGGMPASLIASQTFSRIRSIARGNIQMADSRAGEIAVPGVVPRLSETPGEIRWLGVGLGAQNEDVYKGLLDEQRRARRFADLWCDLRDPFFRPYWLELDQTGP